MRVQLYVLVQRFNPPMAGNEVHFNTDDMTHLARLFNTRYVTPVIKGTEAGIDTTEMCIVIDGVIPYTQEQQDYLRTKTFRVQGLPMPEQGGGR